MNRPYLYATINYYDMPVSELNKRIRYYNDNLWRARKFGWLKDMMELWTELKSQCERELVGRN